MGRRGDIYLTIKGDTHLSYMFVDPQRPYFLPFKTTICHCIGNCQHQAVVASIRNFVFPHFRDSLQTHTIMRTRK